MEFIVKRENGVTIINNNEICSDIILYRIIGKNINGGINTVFGDRSWDEYTFDLVCGCHKKEINRFPERDSFKEYLNTLDTPEKVENFLREVKTEIENFIKDVTQDSFPETKIII